MKIKVPKNLGDVIYSFRFRVALPASISAKAPPGMSWAIRFKGKGLYRMTLMKEVQIQPNPLLLAVKIPDATPGIVALYSSDDEQSLLTKVRYNRLIDLFTGVTCYSLQNHLRTTVPGMGNTQVKTNELPPLTGKRSRPDKSQVETDELYIGVDRRGAHFIFPVQAKGGSDRMSIVQIEQDLALCAHKFPDCIRIAIGVQFMPDGVIVLYGFEESGDGLAMTNERHFRLIPSDQLSAEELQSYRESPFP